jgi:integrase
VKRDFSVSPSDAGRGPSGPLGFLRAERSGRPVGLAVASPPEGLSRQALDIFMALKTFAGGSEWVLPSRYDAGQPMSNATLNRVLELVYTQAQKDGKELGKFGPHDLRRTASTLLHEAGYNTDWIEKCLAHEQRGVRAVYNKAEYREQRSTMLQDWADMIDDWTIKKR